MIFAYLLLTNYSFHTRILITRMCKFIITSIIIFTYHMNFRNDFNYLVLITTTFLLLYYSIAHTNTTKILKNEKFLMYIEI
jgi:hypothetical protein